MRSTLQIGRWGGIPLQFHWSFAIVFIWVVYTSWEPGFGIDTEALLTLGVWVGLVFGSVILHEYGHAFMASAFKIPTNKIVIYPIGGGAFLERMPEEPRAEILVAIAGPLVNVALALALMPFVWHPDFSERELLLAYLLDQESNVPVYDVDIWDYVFTVGFVLNLILAFFNLIPAYPLDGGRIFRAALTRPLGRIRATWVAAGMGVLFSVAFLWIAWLRSDWLFALGSVLIGLFAGVELLAQRKQLILLKHQVSQHVRTNFPRIYTTDLLADVAHFRQNGWNTLLVFNQWQDEVGVLSEKEWGLWESLGKPPNSKVAEFMQTKIVGVDTSASLLVAAKAMEETKLELLAVYHHGNLLGAVSAHDLNTFIKSQSPWHIRRNKTPAST